MMLRDRLRQFRPADSPIPNPQDLIRDYITAFAFLNPNQQPPTIMYFEGRFVMRMRKVACPQYYKLDVFQQMCQTMKMHVAQKLQDRTTYR